MSQVPPNTRITTTNVVIAVFVFAVIGGAIYAGAWQFIEQEREACRERCVVQGKVFERYIEPTGRGGRGPGRCVCSAQPAP